MTRDTRNGIFILGFLLTLFAVFCLWFLRYQMPGASPADIPSQYWGSYDRILRHQVTIIGLPLVVGNFMWLLFAWRLVRRLNQLEPKSSTDYVEPESGA